jgi:hypothetical protein
MSIEKLLETKQGAIAVKSKLKAMPDREKEKDSYKVIWKKACDAVDGFNLEKMQKAHGVKATTLPEKSKTNKMTTKNTSKSHENKTIAKPLKKEKQPEPPKQKQFSVEEVDAGIKRLCDSFPMAFSLTEYKPLKVGVDHDIKCDQLDWDIDLLKAVMKKYVRNEKYVLNTITMKYRYDLQGMEAGEIEDGGREHGIEQLKKLMGRLALAEKYPEYVKAVEPHKPFCEYDHAFLYYCNKDKQEVFNILVDCYGRKIRHKLNVDILEDGKRKCRLKIISHKGDETIIESAVFDDRRQASFNCYKRALVRLQNTIKAYPFEYAKPKMTEEDIV